jgi:putative ABC transport system ATP-binding protein
MQALIDLREITKTYDMGEVKITALHAINLKIFSGEMIAIQGASGSGKSTLMNILGCLDRPTSGTYILNDQDVSKMTPNQLARVRNKMIGFVFQGFNLLSRTSALENVELPLVYSGVNRKQSKRMATEALKSLGLAERISHLPNQLSGGQQQRVAISRALVTQPQMILADEPTGNLDTVTSLEVMAVFQELNSKGITIVLITHEYDISLYCRRVVVLKDGRIVKDLLNEPRNALADKEVADAESKIVRDN